MNELIGGVEERKKYIWTDERSVDFRAGQNRERQTARLQAPTSGLSPPTGATSNPQKRLITKTNFEAPVPTTSPLRLKAPNPEPLNQKALITGRLNTATFTASIKDPREEFLSSHFGQEKFELSLDQIRQLIMLSENWEYQPGRASEFVKGNASLWKKDQSSFGGKVPRPTAASDTMTGTRRLFYEVEDEDFVPVHRKLSLVVIDGTIKRKGKFVEAA
ncbi:hypothetical protein GP486_007830 [Trichoglossum hirsutum]|uniref:Uncharacterized protein n=1 Tax=Trichoglossum hirsutum TaxID=265104 RepID=A0A9P8IET3_9PEZI|nr:hypothetical protein GP486_007830 [Trichoglossum hirsutum]